MITSALVSRERHNSPQWFWSFVNFPHHYKMTLNSFNHVFPPLRDWALFASLALLHDHGGQFSEGGRAATDARSGCSLPPLAKPRWLAGAADCHHQPFRSDAALRLVSPTLWRHQWDWEGGGWGSSHSEPGDGLYSTHCKAVLSPLLFNLQTILSFFGFLPPLGPQSNRPLSLRPSHPFFFPLCYAGFFRSRCAGCWPPSTTSDPKKWCCASPGRTG